MSFRPSSQPRGLFSLAPSPYSGGDVTPDVFELPTRVDLPAMSNSRPPPATWAPGAIVPGTVYRVIRPLGAGGMGEVYEAEQLKVLSRKMASREDLAERLRVEARALAGLRHSNLVQVHDLGVSTDGRVFFAMELLEGATLREMLRRAGRLKPEQAVAIAVQVLEALGAAHERGMVHRDVKPENVFIQRTGAVKLLDFGVAKAMAGGAPAQPLTAAGMAIGTPRYMSPEQAEGQPVDTRSDLYAVGILLWEMLAGRPPYHHLDGVAAAVAAVTRGVPSLTDAGVDDAPAPLVEAIRRATARSPAARFPTASAFAAELRMARARTSSVPGPVEKITVRYEESATSLVPLLPPPEAGGPTDDLGALTGEGRTSQTSVQTGELTSSETSEEATELRSSLPFDPREEPTPTAMPMPSASSPTPTASAAPLPVRPPPSAAFPASFWIGVPAAIVVTALATLFFARPQPMPKASLDEPAAQPAASPATSSAPPAAPSAPAASAASAASAEPPAQPAASASAPASSPAPLTSSPSKKPPAKGAISRPASKPKTGSSLPGSGL